MYKIMVGCACLHVCVCVCLTSEIMEMKYPIETGLLLVSCKWDNVAMNFLPKGKVDNLNFSLIAFPWWPNKTTPLDIEPD